MAFKNKIKQDYIWGENPYYEVQNLSFSRLLYKKRNLNIRAGQPVNLRIGFIGLKLRLS